MKYNNVGQKTCEKVKKKLIFDKFLCFLKAKMVLFGLKHRLIMVDVNFILYLCVGFNLKTDEIPYKKASFAVLSNRCLGTGIC